MQEEKRKWPELLEKASATAAAQPGVTQQSDQHAAVTSGESSQTELGAKEEARKQKRNNVVKVVISSTQFSLLRQAAVHIF